MSITACIFPFFFTRRWRHGNLRPNGVNVLFENIAITYQRNENIFNRRSIKRWCQTTQSTWRLRRFGWTGEQLSSWDNNQKCSTMLSAPSIVSMLVMRVWSSQITKDGWLPSSGYYALVVAWNWFTELVNGEFYEPMKEFGPIGNTRRRTCLELSTVLFNASEQQM